ADGRIALVEVKRIRAVASAVEQVVRYREQAERDPSLGRVRALVVAPDFAPQARVLADARGVERVTLDVGRLIAEAEADLTRFSTPPSARDPVAAREAADDDAEQAVAQLLLQARPRRLPLVRRVQPGVQAAALRQDPLLCCVFVVPHAPGIGATICAITP